MEMRLMSAFRMRVAGLSVAALAVIAGAAAGETPSMAPRQEAVQVPQFEFDVWGRPPAPEVYDLATQRLVQGILYVTSEQERTVGEIAAATGASEDLIREKLARLEFFQFMRSGAGGWIANIPLYTRADIAAAEAVGLEYAQRQADILRREIPRLRELYGRTTLAKSFRWDEVSLLIVGALLSDFCVVDRIPFRPENSCEQLQPRLHPVNGKPWSYDGYEKVPTRFPSRPWKFYQNVFSKGSSGMARFGYYKNPDEQRQPPAVNPGQWLMSMEGAILRVLAEGPRSLDELHETAGFDRSRLESTLQAMMGYRPPAIVCESGVYRTRVPILTESDLSLLLPECDRIAGTIFNEVVLPHLVRCETRAAELGRRWPLPGETFVRDKALATLAGEGLISPVPAPPVPWNFGLWGWKGFLAMHQEVTDNAQLDPFLKTAVSEQEAHELAQFETHRASVLNGNRFHDNSTPVNAFLTRISGFLHRDVEALKAVQIPAHHIDEKYFTNPRNQAWTDYMRRITVRRTPSTPASPKDGDISPVFTMDDRGFEEAHIYFYYQGGWRLLCNTPKDALWHITAREWLPNKLAALNGDR
jgi:hypothetical protein